MKVKPQEPKNPPGEVQRRVKEAHLKFDDQGRELMDPIPIAPPIGYKKSPSIAETIRNMIRSEKLKQEAEAAGYETFEEADDFEVDDFDPKSPYEEQFEPIPVPDTEAEMSKFANLIGASIMEQLGGASNSREGPDTPPPARQPQGAEPPAPDPSLSPAPSPSLDFTTRKPKS